MPFCNNSLSNVNVNSMNRFFTQTVSKLNSTLTTKRLLLTLVVMAGFSIGAQAQLNSNTQCTVELTNGNCGTPFTLFYDPWGSNQVLFNVTSGTVSRNGSGVVTVNINLVRQGNSGHTATLAMTMSG